MKAALEKAGTKHEMERFPGTHQGFCFVEREVYDRLAAERAWLKTFDLLKRALA